MCQVWRDACAPLYHCRCGICERAMAKANSANENTTSPTAVHSQAQTQVQAPPAAKEDPVTIKLEEVVDVDGEGEEEVDTTELEEEEEEGSEEDMEGVGDVDGYAEIASDEDDSSSWFEPASPTPVVSAPRSRKRSSDELDAVDDNDSGEEGKRHRYPGRGGTPPKRARTISEAVLIPKRGAHVAPPPSPRRMRKRSSEELEDRNAREDLMSKRLKVASVVDDRDDVQESPPPPSDSSLLSSTSTEDSEDITMKRVSQADLDQLYVLGDD